ncbi:hypothetical protein FOXB_09281 [Fusarium oxysporum f. sp. conglutinans Fo5176]|uniref:Uncharacterized protein n=1 Tax=Fusarium oxysporum (strain Fo5176) TaxID=660025 RepID=F9FSA0_FUSOF|nr:hypothetical protein FOXB_09281 [Fusarium oxysporum f. sp. conglutinans Fo5176]
MHGTFHKLGKIGEADEKLGLTRLRKTSLNLIPLTSLSGFESEISDTFSFDSQVNNMHPAPRPGYKRDNKLF